MSVVEAAASGNRLELLLALRTRLAWSINDPACPARDLAALTRRIMDVAKEIAEIQERIQQEIDEQDKKRKLWVVDSV